MIIDLREKNLSEYKDSFGFHYYSILAYLSTLFNDSIIVDLGTLYGNSAAALAYNKTNKVYTYDIESRPQAISKFKLKEFKNIEYIITNCIEDNWQRQTDQDIILASKLIFLDVDPLDGNVKGEQEDKVLNFLISNNWKGVLVCDDIGVEWIDEYRSAAYTTLPIREWWESIDLPTFKIINKYSSPTGTGIICFDNQEVIYTPLTKDEEEYVINKFCQDPASWPYSPTQVPIDRFKDGTFKVSEGHLNGVTGTWEETMIDKVGTNVAIYDNGITTFKPQLNENGEKIVPKKILLIKTWAGQTQLVDDWEEVRYLRSLQKAAPEIRYGE